MGTAVRGLGLRFDKGVAFLQTVLLSISFLEREGLGALVCWLQHLEMPPRVYVPIYSNSIQLHLYVYIIYICVHIIYIYDVLISCMCGNFIGKPLRPKHIASRCRNLPGAFLGGGIGFTVEAQKLETQ